MFSDRLFGRFLVLNSSSQLAMTGCTLFARYRPRAHFARFAKRFSRRTWFLKSFGGSTLLCKIDRWVYSKFDLQHIWAYISILHKPWHRQSVCNCRNSGRSNYDTTQWFWRYLSGVISFVSPLVTLLSQSNPKYPWLYIMYVDLCYQVLGGESNWSWPPLERLTMSGFVTTLIFDTLVKMGARFNFHWIGTAGNQTTHTVLESSRVVILAESWYLLIRMPVLLGPFGFWLTAP